MVFVLRLRSMSSTFGKNPSQGIDFCLFSVFGKHICLPYIPNRLRFSK